MNSRYTSSRTGGTPVSQITCGPRRRAASGVGSGDPRVRVGGRGSVVLRCLVVEPLLRVHAAAHDAEMRDSAPETASRTQHCWYVCTHSNSSNAHIYTMCIAPTRLPLRYHHQYMSIDRLVAASLKSML